MGSELKLKNTNNNKKKLGNNYANIITSVKLKQTNSPYIFINNINYIS